MLKGPALGSTDVVKVFVIYRLFSCAACSPCHCAYGIDGEVIKKQALFSKVWHALRLHYNKGKLGKSVLPAMFPGTRS